MVHRPLPPPVDEATNQPPPAVMRFVLATGSLMSLFAVASVWVGELLGG